MEDNTLYKSDIEHFLPEHPNNQEIEDRDKLKAFSDNVPIQVWYLNDSNTYISANKAHADFIGVERHQFTFKNIKDFFSKEEAETCIEGNEIVFKQKKQMVIKEWLYNSYGEKRLLRITKTPKLNLKGDIEFVICSGEDITQEYINKEENEIKERILYSAMDFTQELLTNENLQDALSNGISMLGNATQVDRVYYWENHYDQESERWLTSQKIEWCLGNVEQQINNPKLQNVPLEESMDFLGILAKNQIFNAHIKDMGDGASTKQVLEAQGILSILAIPVFVKDQFKGFIGFDSCNFEKEWSQVEISLLKSFILMYVKAQEKNLLEKQIIQVKENFYNFFNMIQDLLFVLDLEGNIIDVNNNVLDRLGYSRKELLGESVLMLHPKAKKDQVKKNIKELINKKIESCNIPAITKEGYVFPVETRTSEGLWNGEPVIFAISKDISQLSMSEEKFSKAFNNSGVSMFITRFANGEFLDVNDTFLDFIGYTREEVIASSALDLEIVRDHENRQVIIDEIEKHQKILDMEVKVYNMDDTSRTGLMNMVPLNINGEKCLLSSIIDITDRKKYEKQLLEISNRDSLTGVYNRRCIYTRAEEIIEEYKRNNKIFSVAIIDIDNFKHVNDKYGHQVGDHVLIEFTNIINDNLCLYDLLGRYGGEEFILILNHSNREESNVVIKRILNIVINKTFKYEGHEIKLTFSAGISSCEDLDKNEISIDSLIGIADKRMYAVKKMAKMGLYIKKYHSPIGRGINYSKGVYTRFFIGVQLDYKTPY